VKASLNLKQYVERCTERIERIRAAPAAVAGGVALGMFWAFTPLVGLKTLLAILFAWMFRCSKISAALTVAFHDILTPIWPIFLRWEYDFGFWILSHPHRFPKSLRAEEFHLEYWLHWNRLEILWPTFMGSFVFAVPSALVSYWIVNQSLRKRVHKSRGQPTPPTIAGGSAL